VARAIDRDLPQGIHFRCRNDEAMRRIMTVVGMPDRMAENLVEITSSCSCELSPKSFCMTVIRRQTGMFVGFLVSSGMYCRASAHALTTAKTRSYDRWRSDALEH
jgi:hypothetical protein